MTNFLRKKDVKQHLLLRLKWQAQCK